jgi:hypothetical protein
VQTQFPVGQDRSLIGALSYSNPVTIKLDVEEIDVDKIDKLSFTIWGEDGQRYSENLEYEPVVNIVLGIDQYNLAKAIGASIYTVKVVTHDGTEQIIAKGRVIL